MNEFDKSFLDSMQSLDRLYEEYAKAKGMTYMSLTVLDVIYEQPECCTQKQICEQTHYPKQSVNLIINTFRESGYIELREIPSDRRNKQIILTAKGKTYADEVIGKLWEADEKATNTLSEKQRDELLKLIKIYENAFSEEVTKLIEM